MKFLVDMPVTPLTVTHLRAAGHDAVHAHEIGLDRAADAQLLDVARREERVIITADLDSPRLLVLHQASRPGIFSAGGAFSDAELLGLLDRVLTRTPALALAGSIVVVDPRRIRRHALPIVE
jgi:predicted nuclease of predicted toxin-antitoxin system